MAILGGGQPVSEEARDLASKIKDYEARLLELIRSPQPDESAIKATRLSLRSKVAKLVLADAEHASRMDVEVNLFKYAFHRAIDDMRRKRTRAEGNLSDPQKRERALKALANIREGLGKFLGEAKGFYTSLLGQLLKRLGLTIEEIELPEPPAGEQAPAGPPPAKVRGLMLLSCQRCLTYLGDLERYAQLNRDEGQRDWDAPRAHYLLGSRLAPHSGLPHHQMAVIATYTDDDLEAACSYARSILAASPHPLGRKNLLMLHEKNEDKCDALGKRGGRSSGAAYASATAAEKGRRMGEFSLRFVRLHAMLYQGNELNSYRGLETSLLVDMLSLVDAGAIDQAALLRMVTVCIFSAHDIGARLSDCGTNGDSNGAASAAHLARSYNFALGLCCKVFMKLSIAARGNDRLLPALCALADWLNHNLGLVAGPLPSDSADNAKELRTTRMALTEHLVDMLNLTRGAEGSILEYRPLPEDVELFGFLPLSAAHKPLLSFSADGTLVGERGVAVEANAGVARRVRLGRLEALAQRLAAGAQPVLFYDSQKGEYSVEGIAQGNGVSTLGVHSQQRGMLRLPDGAAQEQAPAGVVEVVGAGDEDGDQAMMTSLLLQDDKVVGGGGGGQAVVEEEADADNDETFGTGMVDAAGDFSMFAQQSQVLAMGINGGSPFALSGNGVSPMGSVGGQRVRPEQDEEATNAHLDYLVELATAGYVDCGPEDKAERMEEDEEQEEIILFQPTAPQGGVSTQSHRVPSGSGLSPASALAPGGPLWGGFGEGSPFGGGLIGGDSVTSPMSWQAQPLISTAGAQAGLREGSEQVSWESRRLKTNNPYAQ